MNCTECGHVNAAATAYCTRCGANLRGDRAGGQPRVTTAEAGLFSPPPPVHGRPASGGVVRRTELEEPAGELPSVRMPPAPPAPPAGGASPAPRSRTVLEEGHPGASAAQASPAARVIGWMVSFDHNPAGQDYTLRAGRTRVGRGRDNEISVFYETKASDLHCTIIWRNGQTAVKDEGSTNGTQVNGEDIGIAGVHPIRSGDTLTIGASTFQVFLLEAGIAGATWPKSAWSQR